MKKNSIFIIVIGRDRKGIVAKVSNLLFRRNINIEDINQHITGSYFVMSMLADTTGASAPLEKVVRDLKKLGAQMNLQIQVQHENIFKMMHRI